MDAYTRLNESKVWPTVLTMVWPKVCSVWPLILTTVWRMVWPTVWTMVWPRVCSVWPLVWTTVWPMVWTTVWPKVGSVCPMSGQSGQWCPKSVQSGQWWPKSARSGQYISLGIVGLTNACFGYDRSGQYLSWVADYILGYIGAADVCSPISRIISTTLNG